MFCDRCGARLLGAVSFCPHCGRQFGAPPPPTISRLQGHLRNVAILWLVYSAFRLIPGLALGSLSNSDWAFPSMADFPFMIHGAVHGALRAISGFLLMTGVLGAIAGWGLYERRSWARTLALILAFFSLFHPPFGTAIGIYTLWVLLPAASEAEYQRTARA